MLINVTFTSTGGRNSVHGRSPRGPLPIRQFLFSRKNIAHFFSLKFLSNVIGIIASNDINSVAFENSFSLLCFVERIRRTVNFLNVHNSRYTAISDAYSYQLQLFNAAVTLNDS